MDSSDLLIPIDQHQCRADPRCRQWFYSMDSFGGVWVIFIECDCGQMGNQVVQRFPIDDDAREMAIDRLHELRDARAQQLLGDPKE